MYCSEAEAGVKVGHAVVGAGQVGLGGDTDIGWGGGTNGRGGVDRQDIYITEICGRML